MLCLFSSGYSTFDCTAPRRRFFGGGGIVGNPIDIGTPHHRASIQSLDYLYNGNYYYRNKEKGSEGKICWSGWRNFSKSQPICQFARKWEWLFEGIYLFKSDRQLEEVRIQSHMDQTYSGFRMLFMCSWVARISSIRIYMPERRAISLCGFGIPIPSIEGNIKRIFRFQNSSNPDFQQIWHDTANMNAILDRIVGGNETIHGTTRDMESSFKASAKNHSFSLKVQGASTKAVTKNIMSQQHQRMESSDGQLASSSLPVCSQSLVASVANQFQSCQIKKLNEVELWSVWRTETDEQARSLQLFSLPRTLHNPAQQHASGDRKLDPRSQIPNQHSFGRYWFEHFSANRPSIPVYDSTQSRVVRCIRGCYTGTHDLFRVDSLEVTFVQNEQIGIRITNNTWISNLKNTWLIYILLKFLCRVLFQFWPTSVVLLICLFPNQSKLAA